jgi:hypothetical protein
MSPTRPRGDIPMADPKTEVYTPEEVEAKITAKGPGGLVL